MGVQGAHAPLLLVDGSAPAKPSTDHSTPRARSMSPPPTRRGRVKAGGRCGGCRAQASVAAQLVQLPPAFSGARVLKYQRTERRWFTVFTQCATRRQVRVYGPSALATCLRRDWTRLASGVRPRIGGRSPRCTWITLTNRALFKAFCAVHWERKGAGAGDTSPLPLDGSGAARVTRRTTRVTSDHGAQGQEKDRAPPLAIPLVQGRVPGSPGSGTVMVWVGPTPNALDEAAARLGVLLTMDNWPQVLAAVTEVEAPEAGRAVSAPAPSS